MFFNKMAFGRKDFNYGTVKCQIGIGIYSAEHIVGLPGLNTGDG